MTEQEINHLAEIVWSYHHLHQPFGHADLLLVLGGHDLRVPEYAAKLFHNGVAPRVVVSGGIAHAGDLLETRWTETEAEKFAEVMVAAGVPREKILLEKEATNTGANFELSKKLLDAQNITFTSAIAVTKPYMERRAFATGAKQWPDKQLVVTSPPISFADYMQSDIGKDNIINIMLGDLQRIDIYGKNGFQIPQDIPTDVWDAFKQLKAAGYTKHLLA